MTAQQEIKQARAAIRRLERLQIDAEVEVIAKRMELDTAQYRANNIADMLRTADSKLEQATFEAGLTDQRRELER